jgi:hypothetical protein
MRGDDPRQAAMFSYLSPEERVPPNYPLRVIWGMVKTALTEPSPQFEALCSPTGRPSIAPEQWLRALLLQMLYTIGPERRLMEPRDDHLRGERRTNATHASATDPEARLGQKATGREAKLAYLGHVLMENRQSLVVEIGVTQATGTAEREAALALIAAIAGRHRITLGADKNDDTRDFVRELRVTPPVAQHTSGRSSAIDGRTTRHPGYAVSQRKGSLPAIMRARGNAPRVRPARAIVSCGPPWYKRRTRPRGPKAPICRRNTGGSRHVVARGARCSRWPTRSWSWPTTVVV